MTWRSPTDPGGPGPASTPGEPAEEPTAMAGLRIFLLPADDGHAVSWGQDPGTIARDLRFPARTRQGQLQARSAPSRCASEMLWAVAVISTLAITVPSGIPYKAIALILAIELTGFAAGAIWARWRLRQIRNRM
jgi:hypothetical protein